MSEVAHAEYLAITQNKLRYLNDYRLRKPAENLTLTWIDAGIFLSSHSHCHGNNPYEITRTETSDVKYATSLSKPEVFSPLKIGQILSGRSRTQMLGATFSINANLLPIICEENDRVVEYSINNLKVIPTEQ